MPNHKSAEKRIRQNEKRRVRNQHYKSTIRNRVKAVRDALEAGQAGQAAEALPAALRQIDKVASKGVIPKRRASRLISRLTKAVNKAQAEG